MFNLITKTSTLWLLFAATIVITFGFSYLSNTYDMVFIDSVSSPETATEMVKSYSPEQIQIHIWTTAILDVLYPLVYGSFFAGVALACYRHFGLFLAIPSFLVIPVDIAEGVVQIYGLMGNYDWLGWKAFLTPLKFGLFFIGFGIALVAWIRWLWQKLRARF